MTRPLLALPLVLAIAACGPVVPGGADANPPGATDPADAGAPAGCQPTVLCYPGCPADDPTCLAGVFEAAACACRQPDGTSIPMPQDGPDGGAAGVTVTSLAYAPAPPARLAKGASFSFRLLAGFSSGVSRDVTASATVSDVPATALERTGPGEYRAVAGGDVTLEAAYVAGAVTVRAAAAVHVYVEEARALWVTRFAYSKADDVRRVVNAAADARFNVVMFQIRGMGDAYYHSTLEPWSARLSGTLGKDPGWDPLQVAIDTAHARGIELHAYFNAFSAWDATTPAASPAGLPNHVFVDHPEWVERDQAGTTVADGYQWLSPGIDAVRAYNTAVARDLLTHYDVDGLHLDRIRYSGSGMGYNALEQEAFRASGQADFAAWRASRVNDQVRQLYGVLREVRPRARLSAAVWGTHTNLPGCHNSAGLDGYFQDSWAWTQGGYIDALCPMIYWAEGSGCTDYGDLLATFMAHKGDREVWAGMHVLDKDAGCSGTCRLNWPALQTRVETARGQHAEGVTLFASAYLDPQALNANQNVWQLLASGPFHDVAELPARGP